MMNCEIQIKFTKKRRYILLLVLEVYFFFMMSGNKIYIHLIMN